MSLFALPLIGSAGLGNELFPWARAEIFARRSQISVVAPRWGRLRLGPYLRGEPEKRRYGSSFRAADHVRGLSRAAIGTFGRRLREGQSDTAYARAKESSWPWIVTFEGIAGLFVPLANEHAFIRERLWQMTRARLRPPVSSHDPSFIAMHVRRGDLTRQGFSEGQLVDVKQFTPLSWFVAMARAVRDVKAVRDCPIVVFTDGTADELAELLAVDGVRLHRSELAITDLWMMAQARTLFASGFSTFSMWASYLGGMPTLYAPGKLQQPVQGGRPDACEEEIAAAEELPEHAFVGTHRSGVPTYE